MKKTAIALAVAAFATAPAMAEVKLSGDYTYEISQTDADDSSMNTAVDSANLNINASTELNNGWTGKISMELANEDSIGGATQFDVGSIALSHAAYGTVTVGGLVYNGTTGRLSAANDGDVDLVTGDGVSYSNTFGGVTAGISLGMSDQDDEEMAVGATYTAGDLTIGAGYASQKGGDFGDDGAAVPNAAAADATATMMSVGATYKMGALSVGGHYEAASNEVDAEDYSSVSVQASYAISDATTVSGHYIMNDNAGDNDDADNTVLNVAASHKMNALTLSGSYELDASGADNDEDASTITVGASYDLGSSYSVGAEVEMAANAGYVDGADTTTTSITVKGAF